MIPLKTNYNRNTVGTSRKQVPRAMREIKPSGKCLNYGCGKYYFMVDQAYPTVQWTHYDMYYQPVMTLPDDSEQFDMVYCCNVLNVIESEIELTTVIEIVMSYTNHAVFSVYSGDKSGIGKETRCGYQRNQLPHEYNCWFDGYDFQLSGNIFEVKKF